MTEVRQYMLQYHRCSINESLVIDVIHDELLVEVDVLVSQKTLMKADITWHSPRIVNHQPIIGLRTLR